MDIHKLNELYKFRDRNKVIDFLEKYPFLVSQLIEACREIPKYFTDFQLFLEIFSDPEEIEDDELILYISSTLSPDEANKKLMTFDKNWWLKVSHLSQDKLCIDLEYR